MCEHWKIADQGDTDEKGRRKLAESIKQGVANEQVLYHPKFGSRKLVSAYRRWTISCNDEPKYLKILPQMDDSLVDKLLILQAFEGGIPEEYRPREKWKEYREMIYSELPAFSHYLRNRPLGDAGKGRFDVADYQAPEILRKMEETNPEHQPLNLMDMEFAGIEREDCVEGTAAQILALLGKESKLYQLYRGSSKAFGRYLNGMVREHRDRFKSRMLHGNRIYSITGFPALKAAA